MMKKYCTLGLIGSILYICYFLIYDVLSIIDFIEYMDDKAWVQAWIDKDIYNYHIDCMVTYSISAIVYVPLFLFIYNLKKRINYE